MKLNKFILSAFFALPMMANAILIERSEEGKYNQGNVPVVDYEHLSKVKKDPTAPNADDVVAPRVYTYNNNTSEYLRDELGLPHEKADERLNQYDSTYIKSEKLDKLLKKDNVKINK